jgi:hypothetical protein
MVSLSARRRVSAVRIPVKVADGCSVEERWCVPVDIGEGAVPQFHFFSLFYLE